MKILFLDFDGVLNSQKFIRSCNECGAVIDPSKMVLLKTLIAETKAKIVLSTSWREHWDKNPDLCDEIGLKINKVFNEHNLEIYDKTPRLNLLREEEIKAWLDECSDVKEYVVLDDALLSADFLMGHFVKTSDYFGGLDENDVKKAIEILSDCEEERK